MRLSGASGEIIGLAKSVQVQVGDKLKMEVYGKYVTPTTDNSGVVAGMAGAFISAFGTPAGATLEGSFLQSVNEILFPAGPFIEPGAWEDDNAPKAYLNYILFDQNYVPYKFGFDQIDFEALEDGSDIAHDLMQLEVTATKNGYAYIYLSNENDKLVDVFFDDLKIEHEYSGIIQQEDFYAFGLSFDQTPDRELNIKYLYNSKELQTDLGLDWYDYGARFYQPDLGRWMVVDPLAADAPSWSPYNTMWNNPIRNIDPDGRWAAPLTDFLNQSTGEKIHISDGKNQTVQVSNADWQYVNQFQIDFRNGITPSNYYSFITQRGAIANSGKNLPNFNQLEINYPKYGIDYLNGGITNEQFGNAVGGKLELNIDAGYFSNTCACRVSHSLNESGVVFP